MDLIESNYKKGLMVEKQEKYSNDATENVLNFYNNNKIICDLAFDYYNNFENNKYLFVKEPRTITMSEFQNNLSEKNILVITVNSIERGIFLRWLSEKKHKPLDTLSIDGLSFNVYYLSDDKMIIHISPNDIGEEYTRRVINKICRLFRPDYICMLGVCYGFDMNRYSIGTVFVSDSIQPFTINYRDDNCLDNVSYEIQEGLLGRPSEYIINLVNNRITYTMMYNILSVSDNPIVAKAYLGKILSNNSIMSSKIVKEAVMDSYRYRRPKPLGGEMEGYGILKSDIVLDNNFNNWIMIKSVCDWGEGKNLLSENVSINNRIKDSIQAFAMTNTCGVFENVCVDLGEER